MWGESAPGSGLPAPSIPTLKPTCAMKDLKCTSMDSPTHSFKLPPTITTPRKNSCPLATPTQILDAKWAGVSRILVICSEGCKRDMYSKGLV